MKKKIVIGLILILSIKTGARPGGIYRSWTDYKTHILSPVFNCDSSKAKISLHHFFEGNFITVRANGNTYKFSKDSIYGYRDCSNKDYRFYKERDVEYEILESRDIVIYKYQVPVINSKGISSERVTRYFFSASLSSDIIPLTLLNLKKAFPGNSRFHDMLDINFNSGNQLAEYDNAHKMYKLNYLLQITTTNN